jgi:hypothetical protein
MQSPIPYNGSFATNVNMLSLDRPQTLSAAWGAREGVFTRVLDLTVLLRSMFPDNVHAQEHQDTTDRLSVKDTDEFSLPHAFFVQPVFASITVDDHDHEDSVHEMESMRNPIVGFLIAAFPWDRFLTNLLPAGSSSLRCVLANSCGQQFTYELNGNAVCVHF